MSLNQASVLLPSTLVYVNLSPGRGRGVFARRLIRRGEVIEVAPTMTVPLALLVDGYENPDVGRFFFEKSSKSVQMALGFGSLYNHSYSPNARYDDGPRRTLVFRAIRDIAKDEEIFVNYNGDPRDRSPVGIDNIV